MIDGLTPEQSHFIETYVLVPKVIRRKKGQRRRDDAIREFRRFNVNRAVVEERIAQLGDAGVRAALLDDLDQAEAIIEAKPKKLDFEGGLAQLVKVNETARLRLQQEQAREKFEAVKARVVKLEKSRDRNKRKGYDRGLDNQADIDLVWSFVQDKYASGMDADNAGDLDSAVKAMDRLDGLIDSAVRIKPFEMRSEALEDAVADAEEGLQDAVQDARRDLTEVSNALVQLKDRATRGFTASAIPADIEALIATVDTRLDAASDAAPAQLSARAAAARTALDAATAATGQRIADKTAWLALDQTFHRTWDMLTDHSQKGEAVYVKPKFDPIKAAHDGALAKVATGDFAGATADVTPLVARAAALLALADDYAHYLGVEADRQALIDGLPDPATYAGVPQMKTAIEAALQLMVDAKAARDAENMADASARLDRIPAAVALYDGLEVSLNGYNSKWNQVDAALTEFAGHPAAVTDKMLTDLQLLETTRDDAEALVLASDLAGGTHKLQAISGFIKALKKKIDLIAEFIVEEPLFQARMEETRLRDGAGGRVAIEEYYQRLRDDAARIVTHSTGPKKEFGLALEAAKALKDVHPEKLELADKAQEYLALKKDMTDEIARLEGGAAGGPLAAKAIALARTTMNDAANAAASGDWQGAIWLLEDADRELDQGTRAAEIAEDIDGLQDPAGFADVAGNFDAALAEFTKAKQHIEALDTDDVFGAKLREAQQTAESGRAFAQANPPDPATAQQKIEAGIAACKAVGTQITLRDLYVDTDQQVAKDYEVTKGWDADKCIKPELEAIKAHLKAAEKLAKAPGLNFEAAMAELSLAAAQVVIGIAAGKVYDDPYKAAADNFKDVLKALEKKDCAPGMTNEIARLRGIATDMKDAFDTRVMATVKAKAAEGEALLQGYLDQAFIYTELVGLYKTNVTDTGAKTLDHPAIPDLVARLRRMIDSVDQQRAERAYFAAGIQVQNIPELVERVKKAIADFPAWETALDAADTAIRDLEARDDPALGPTHDRIVALRERFEAARKEAAADNFANATRRLNGFVTDCDAVEAEVDLFDRYLSARDGAIAAITGLSSSDTGAIAPLFKRLEGKRDNALAKAAGFDFDAAITLLTELLSDCATAATALDGHQVFGQVLDQIKQVSDGDTDDLGRAIRQAEATFKQLRGKPSALYVKTGLDAVQASLQLARSELEDDFDAARAAVESAVEDCRRIAVEMGQYDQLCDAAELARKLGAVLAGHPQYPAEKPAVDAGLAGVEQAMNGVRMQNAPRPAASQAVEAVIAEFRRLQGMLDNHAAYVAARDQVRFDLNNKLEKHKDRHLARADMVKAQEALAEAETRAGTRAYKEAHAELNKARERIASGLLRIKTSANEVPTEDDIKAFLKDKAGIALLDEVINNLEPAILRKVIAVVFKARFGCDLKMSNAQYVQVNGKWVPEATADDDLDRPAPNLRRFYKEMSRLPPKDTLDNESMLVFEHQGGVQTGSYFDSEGKVVAMHEGEAKTTAIYAISQEVELGPQDDAVKCEDGEPVTYFGWNTLHEVAHAVDDRIGFMDRHDGESNDSYGGWISYQSNVMPIARAIAGEFDFDAAYVAEFMARGKKSAPPIPEPVGCDAEEWDRRRRDCEIWVNRARKGNDPWATKISADACTIGNRVYHEAYKNDWVSYLASARAKGVSGYQFRAPGEWFAELYAAFHSGKLKNTHPASGWLKDL